MQIGKKETTNPFGKTSEVGYFKLQNDGYLALNNTIAGIFSIYVKCTSTGTINIGSDERTISTAWMRYIFYKIPLNCQVLFTQGEYFIYGAKLESGNKVTDWTAAPEDIQNQFTIITNTISGVSSKVDNVEKSIVNKVWQTDITSKINEYNNTTVKEIVDRVTKTETDINGVTTTVSTMKTNYDGQITSLETKQTQTDSKLGWLVSSGTSSSDFTLTDRTAELVSKYINLHGLVTFKGLSSDVNGKFTKYDGWGGTTDSTKINGAMIETGSIKAEQIAANAITAIKIAANAVTADKISAYGLSVLHKTTGVKTLEIDASGNVNLNVNSLQIASKDVPTKTEVTQSIKDIQVGGRNLQLGSQYWSKSAWLDTNGSVIIDGEIAKLPSAGYPKCSLIPVEINKQYTVSFDIKADVATNISPTYGVLLLDFLNASYARSTYIWISGELTSDWKRITHTFTVPNKSDVVYLSIGLRNTDSIESVYFRKVKLEKGNKATDWTPAPEDLTADAQAKAAEALASAKTYADTQIKVTADGINQNVSKVQAASIISSQEQFYQSTSSTSLTGGSWSNTQPAWANGKYIWRRTLVTYGNNKTGYTPSETGVCITGNTGATGKGIKSTAVTYQASSLGTTVPTGTWSSSVPATDASNPYLWTRTVITYTDNTTSTSYTVGSTTDGISIGGRNLLQKYINAGGQCSKISDTSIKIGTGVGDTYFKLKTYATLKKGEIYTISCDAENVPDGCCWLFGVTRQAATWRLRIDKNGRCYATGTPVMDISAGEEFILDDTGNVPTTPLNIVLSNFKLEKGNKATDWTPAPEDLATADSVEGKLTELRQEVNSNIEETGEAIKSSVYEKVYLKDDVDTLLSSVNTEVEQTKTSWQVTFNQLVKQLNDYSDGSDAAFDEIRKYIRFEDGNILLGNSSSPLILRIRNDRIQFLQNGYEVAYISDQRMYNTTCEIINQLRIADSAWTVEYNASGDTVISLVGI